MNKDIVWCVRALRKGAFGGKCRSEKLCENVCCSFVLLCIAADCFGGVFFVGMRVSV